LAFSDFDWSGATYSWSDVPTNNFPTLTSTPLTIASDVSQIHDAIVVQEEPATIGSLNGYSLGPAGMPSGLSLQNGVTNTINATLGPTNVVALPLTIDASQWTSLFDNTAPTAPTPVASPFSLDVEPYISGRNAGVASAPPIGLFWVPSYSSTTSNGTTTNNTFQPSYNAFTSPASCSTGVSITTETLPILCVLGTTTCSGAETITETAGPLLTSDTDFGSVPYSDAFPASWQRVFTYCQQASLPLPELTNTVNHLGLETITYGYNLINSESIAPPTAPVVPLLSPVQNPTLNGASLFTQATLDTRALTLSWTKPAMGTPYGYRVQIYTLPQSLPSGAILAGITPRNLYTAQTTVSIPPELLTSGVTYLFDITALMDGKANVETSPRRSALPTAAANVVSAPITISASAP
jgi:hypothetical protein